MSIGSNKYLKCSVSAPGKVILHGEHAVVFGKTAVAASLGMRCRATIQEEKAEGNPLLKLHLTNIQLRDISFDLVLLKSTFANIPLMGEGELDWRTPELIDHDKYLEKISSLVEDFKTVGSAVLTEVQTQALVMILYLFCGITQKTEMKDTIVLSVVSELTIGAGTGSSASFAVSLAAVFIQYLRLKIDIEGNNLKYFEQPEKRIISQWGFCAERIAHGSPSGIDNATCTYGSLIEFKKGHSLKTHKLNTELRVILVDSKVSRQTKTMVQKVASFQKNNPGFVDPLLNLCDNIATTALEVLVNSGNNPDDSHTIDFPKLGGLFGANHILLVTLDVSHPSLERIQTLSAECGFSSKLTGAGGGGFAIVLLPPNADESKVEELMKSLTDEGFGAQITKLGGKGVTIEEND